jgi:hypothetical protein
MVSPGLGSIPRTNSAANRPGIDPPSDRSGYRPRCPSQLRSRPRRPTTVPAPRASNAVSTVKAGLPRPSGRTEKGRALPPTNTTSLLRVTPKVCAQKGRLPAVHRAHPASPIRRSTSRHVLKQTKTSDQGQHGSSTSTSARSGPLIGTIRNRSRGLLLGADSARSRRQADVCVVTIDDVRAVLARLPRR